jgi:hypothetical protein
VPKSAKEISKDFLVRLLRAQRLIDDTTDIASFHLEKLKGGVHFQVVRVVIEYAHSSNPPQKAPRSIVVKMIDSSKLGLSPFAKIAIFVKKQFPTAPFYLSAANDDLLTRLQAYDLELAFYRHFATLIPIPTPRCLYNHEDYYNVQFFMAMEDLSNLDIGEPDGFTFDQAGYIVENLALFHSRFLQGDDRLRLAKKMWKEGGYWFGEKEMPHDFPFIAAFNQMISNFGQVLTLNPVLGKRLSDVVDWVTRIAHEAQPKTIIHGDYKISNLFVDNGLNKIYTIDWQWIGMGNPATDLAYFTSTSLQISEIFDGSHEENLRSDRPYGYYDNKELELLRRYHKALQHKGIVDYDFDVLEQQYLLNVIYFYIFAVRAKYAKMSVEDIENYRKSSKDGLHLRHLAHIQSLTNRVDRFLGHINRPLLEEAASKKL